MSDDHAELRKMLADGWHPPRAHFIPVALVAFLILAAPAIAEAIASLVGA